MFGYRADGVKLKGIDPIQRITPHIMSSRHDSQNSTRYEVRCEPFDAFIRSQREKGYNFNYMHIIAAAIIRTFAEFPRLNRFVMNGRLFARKNGIYLSFVVKKNLSASAADSVAKLNFKGTENIYEIKEKIDDIIKQNNKIDSSNNTDKLARTLTFVPNFLIKVLVGLLKWFDKHGLLPQSIINASPFHTSVFITNLKSIKGEYIYHHLYDFGTTGLFIAMGKEAMKPVVEEGQVVPGKVMNLGIVTDERFCDGFYYVTAHKTFKKYMSNPELLINNIDKLAEDVEVDFPSKIKKREKKAQKQALKEAKKANKSKK